MGYTAIARGDFVEKFIHNKHGKAAIERRLAGDSTARKSSTIKFDCNAKAIGPTKGQQDQRKNKGHTAKQPEAKDLLKTAAT